MTAEVVVLGGWTKLPIPVERVLDGAKDLETVLVLGWDKEGRFYAASSDPDGNEMVSIAQRFIHKYYRGDYDSD